MNTGPQTILYISRELERAMGMVPSATYRIVTNRTPYAEAVHAQYPDYVTLIEDTGKEAMGTGDLIIHPITQKVIADIRTHTGQNPYILVFKNTLRIEPLATSQGLTLLNPSAAIGEKIENKLSQLSWLGPLSKYLPPHRVEITKNIRFTGTPFILQWAHGHTGGGTILISREEELKAIQEKFPERRSRVTDFIQGSSFTVNVVVTADRIIPSTVSYQITGLAPFTDSAFSTVGNDWSLANSILNPSDKEWIKTVIAELGAKMHAEKWRGLFGIDMIRDEHSGKMYLIELNARQPASSTYESALQLKERAKGLSGLTTFEAHLKALVGESIKENIIPIKEGAQIVQRVTKNISGYSEDAVGSLELAGFTVIAYENTKENEDLIRIQSENGIMKGHNELGDVGQKICEILE